MCEELRNGASPSHLERAGLQALGVTTQSPAEKGDVVSQEELPALAVSSWGSG